MLKEACSTVHPTFGRRIRPETKAVRHTFDAHIFDFSSLLLHGAHSPIDHLHACNGIVDSFRQKPKTIYLFSHTAENFQPFSGKVTGKSIREQRQSLYEALTEKPTAPITDEG